MYVLTFKNVTLEIPTDFNAGDTKAVTSLLDVLLPFGIFSPTICPCIEQHAVLKLIGKSTS